MASDDKFSMNEYLFQQIYSAHFAELVRHAMRYVQKREVAEDIVQDLYTKLWDNRDSLIDVETIRSYLYRSVTNKCLNYVRDFESRVSTIDDKEIVIAQKSIDETNAKEQEDEEAQVYEELFLSFDQLSPRAREVILYALDGYTTTEIAEQMGISYETVKTLKKRAYASIRAYLGLD
ncbi:RNA polymerase sigma factor [Porphyromonas levii]|uniref:RNA polymerase sigma factor n=1 Tax=Porphyromonas levii TaxID=28114 RepID=UPI001B8D9E93|nr:sigma-70 family RNA polymerase sigma factor [Porphyromonas levii]MBR8703403.1 hypothetical protein [Porphyromonas levii]MBR8760459.1 hypothetical protein [Porphyromonas levii]